MTASAKPPSLIEDLAPVAGELLDVAIAWLTARKAPILAAVDAQVVGGGAAIATALEADLSAKGGIWTLVGGRVAQAAGDAVLAAERAGETDLGNLFDAGLAALTREAAALGG